MTTAMHVSIDIHEFFLRRAQELAAREQTTLDALVQEGLNRVANDRAERAARQRTLDARPPSERRQIPLGDGKVMPGIPSPDDWQAFKPYVRGGWVNGCD